MQTKSEISSGFPERVFVRREKDGPDTYLLVFETEHESVEEDGPTIIAEYSRIKVVKACKVVSTTDRF